MKAENVESSKSVSDVVIIKRCHLCGHLIESSKEPMKCNECGKAFLPSNYFSKVHAKTSNEFYNLFEEASELHPDDLVKGLSVLW